MKCQFPMHDPAKLGTFFSCPNEAEGAVYDDDSAMFICREHMEELNHVEEVSDEDLAILEVMYS